MCLPELLMDVMIIKGDTIKLSLIVAVPCHFYSVSCQIHIMGCDVMFSCHVIGPLIKRHCRCRAQRTGSRGGGEIPITRHGKRRE